MHLGSSGPVAPAARVSAARDPLPVSTESRRPGRGPAALRGSFLRFARRRMVQHIYLPVTQASSRRGERDDGKAKTKMKQKQRTKTKTKARDSLGQETFLWAGRARNTDGTHPRASSGARSVVSGLFPEASVAGMAASLICLRQVERTQPPCVPDSRGRRSWSRFGGVPRFEHAHLSANLRRAGRDSARLDCLVRWGIH